MLGGVHVSQRTARTLLQRTLTPNAEPGVNVPARNVP